MLGSVFRRYKRTLITVGALTFLAGVNAGPAWTFVANYEHQQLINSADYKRQYGHWDVVDLPADVQVNAIHAALLRTGKLLIVAGSGNDETQFKAGTFKTLIYDPATGKTSLIPTPTDLFCGGHAFLPNGNLLIAGGTLRYEVLQDKVTNAAGTITVKNESPHGGVRTFPTGTEFVASDGRKYRAGQDFTIAPATKVEKNGKITITPSAQPAWVEAEQPGQGWANDKPTQYTITGLTGDDVHDVYGLGTLMTLDKQDYHGRKESYEFNPDTERYERVGDLNDPRWYPTLTGLPNGDVIAVSGLDASGNVVDGDNEIYDPVTKAWTTRPDLKRYFPTYPALFQTEQASTLFYSGSNSGYGPATKGRAPGLWDLKDNSFTEVPGLRDADQLETSGSSWIGPFQDQRMMVVGGGGVGESTKSTSRIDVIDLKDESPRFTPGPDLPQGTRYPSIVTLPDDTSLITGGSSDYRGKGASDNHTARIYHPDSNTLSGAADPSVGRDYHSEALLLPNAQVITLGSNSLFSDAKDTITAPFEQRIEIYTPPYLFQGPRPVVTDGPAVVQRGKSAQFSTPDAARIATARLIRPSAVTHVTNVEQRSIALDLSKQDGKITVGIPAGPTVVPPGDYMLFVTDVTGVPSMARWVHIP
jgi:hypothetical protein